jgi:hypothetical protein
LFHEIIPKDDKQKYREISKSTEGVSPSEIIPEILIIHDPMVALNNENIK